MSATPEVLRTKADVTTETMQAVVKGKDDPDSTWKEVVEIASTSATGAGFYIPRECPVGTIVAVMLPLPAHLDTTHGFFNGSSVFLMVHGAEQQPCEVDIRPPAGRTYKEWRVATTLPEAGGRAGARRHGFGLYRAAGYDELIDHPVEMGSFALHTFKACGVPHEVAITGHHDIDAARLCEDLRRICEWQIRLFGEPAPFER